MGLPEDMKVLYLQRMYSAIGRDALRGRRLVDAFRQQADCVLAHIVVDELPEPLDPRLGTDMVSRASVARFQPDVLFLEGGLFSGVESWRFERRHAEQFVRDGGVFIVADVNANAWTLR